MIFSAGRFASGALAADALANPANGEACGGVAFGVGMSVFLGWAVPRLSQLPIIGKHVAADLSMSTQVTGWSIIVAFLVAAATGLVFGLYPAVRAAKQDPIVALRHD